jgi:hypothetical protein
MMFMDGRKRKRGYSFRSAPMYRQLRGQFSHSIHVSLESAVAAAALIPL